MGVFFLKVNLLVKEKDKSDLICHAFEKCLLRNLLITAY